MDKKKITAALAAVSMYIKTQEEALLSPVPVIPEPEAPALDQPPVRSFNLWGVSGRQTQMQANAMIQLRMFK